MIIKKNNQNHDNQKITIINMPATVINKVHLECEGYNCYSMRKTKGMKGEQIEKIADGENKLLRAQNKKCPF